MYVYQLNVETEIEPDLEKAIDGDEHTDWGYFNLREIKMENTGEYMYKLAELVLS